MEPFDTLQLIVKDVLSSGDSDFNQQLSFSALTKDAKESRVLKVANDTLTNWLEFGKLRTESSKKDIMIEIANGAIFETMTASLTWSKRLSGEEMGLIYDFFKNRKMDKKQYFKSSINRVTFTNLPFHMALNLFSRLSAGLVRAMLEVAPGLKVVSEQTVNYDFNFLVTLIQTRNHEEIKPMVDFTITLDNTPPLNVGELTLFRLDNNGEITVRLLEPEDSKNVTNGTILDLKQGQFLIRSYTVSPTGERAVEIAIAALTAMMQLGVIPTGTLKERTRKTKAN